MNGKSITCATCNGHGKLQHVVNRHSDECGDCGGGGSNWLYNGGAIAKYYSGPLVGRESRVVASHQIGERV